MKVRIMFDWAGTIYDWYIDWEMPFFPRKGDTFEFSEFVDEEVIKDFKDIRFKGRYKYAGLEKSILGMLQNAYNTKIVNINWMPRKVELQITTDLFDNDSSLWEEILEK